MYRRSVLKLGAAVAPWVIGGRAFAAPSKDANPAPAAAAWDSAPRGKWIEIPNTRCDQLAPALNRSFVERGNTGFTSIMSAWSGAAFDEASGKFWCFGGGHNDSNNNGLYEFDAEALKWRIAMQPSDYSDPVWNECNARYAAAKVGLGNVNHPFDPKGGANVWKDGKPVAQHSYGTMVYVPAIGVLMLRDGVRLYDPVSGTGKFVRSVLGGHPVENDSHSFYDGRTIYLMGVINGNYWAVLTYDPSTNEDLGPMHWRTPGDPAKFNWAGTSSTQISGTRTMFFWNQQTSVGWTIDFATGLAAAVPGVAGLFASDGIVTLCHAPQVGVVALLKSGETVIIDPASGATSNQGGLRMPAQTISNAGMLNGTWGRFRYYRKRNALVLLAGTDENVRVFRLT